MRMLVDTCTFLWMADDAPELSAQARAIVTDPNNEVYLSAASVWEMGVPTGSTVLIQISFFLFSIAC